MPAVDELLNPTSHRVCRFQSTCDHADPIVVDELLAIWRDNTDHRPKALWVSYDGDNPAPQRRE